MGGRLVLTHALLSCILTHLLNVEFTDYGAINNNSRAAKKTNHIPIFGIKGRPCGCLDCRYLFPQFVVKNHVLSCLRYVLLRDTLRREYQLIIVRV